MRLVEFQTTCGKVLINPEKVSRVHPEGLHRDGKERCRIYLDDGPSYGWGGVVEGSLNDVSRALTFDPKNVFWD